jgi:very-short-patch-repair endonuclease
MDDDSLRSLATGRRQAAPTGSHPLAVRPGWPATGGPLTYQQALALATRGQLRGKAFRKMLPGIYLPAATTPDLGHWIAAWRLKLPADAVLGGLSAAYVLGVPWFAGGTRVEVIQVPPLRVRPHPQLRVRGDLLRPDEVGLTAFGPATSGARTAFDLSRSGSLASAVARVDAVLRATGTGAADVRDLAGRYPGARGIRQGRLVADLADPRAESPPESKLRVLLVEAGVHGVEPQFVVQEQGRFIARLDLAVPELRIGFEYEGSYHRNADQFSRDLLRHNVLRGLGWTIIRIDAAQLRDPEALLRHLKRLVPGLFPRQSTPMLEEIAHYRAERSHRRRTRGPGNRRVRP